MAIKYKKYNLNLDPSDSEDKILIKYLEDNQNSKRKNSYSAILRKALKILIKQEANDEKGGDEAM